MLKEIHWSKMTWQQKAGTVNYVLIVGVALGPALKMFFGGMPVGGVALFFGAMCIANLARGVWLSIK